MPSLTFAGLTQALVGGSFALGYVVLVRRHATVGVAILLAVIAFVPIWVGITLIAFVPAVSGVALLTALALAPGSPMKLTLGDLLVAFLITAALAPLAIGRLSISSAFGVVTVWLAGYLVGRVLPARVPEERIYLLVLVVFSLVSGLAVVEFATGWHGLASWGPSNSSRAAWGSIQTRSGLDRAEGAFGHSIALGASLAMAMVLSLGARVQASVRFGAVLLMLVATAMTLSRLSLVSAFIGLAISLAFLRAPNLRATRRGLAVALVAGSALLVPFLGGVFETAGQEASTSTSYRGDLVALLPHVSLLGYSDAMQVAANGTLYYGGFRSIDSELLLLGLSYGWLALVVALTLLALAVFSLVARRGGSPALVAVVAQLPALAAVALITQYSLFFWFVVGLAVATQGSTRVHDDLADPACPVPSSQPDHRGRHDLP